LIVAKSRGIYEAKHFWTGIAVCVQACVIPILSLTYISANESLVNAAWRGDIGCVRACLRWGADPNAETEFGPPLLAAVQGGDEEVVAALLEAGANLDVISEDGRSMVRIAADNNRFHLVKLLKSYGAKP
jgi:ankyrin repeat protein